MKNHVMVLVHGLPIGHHYKIVMSAHCHKAVSNVLRPGMLLGYKMSINRQLGPLLIKACKLATLKISI